MLSKYSFQFWFDKKEHKYILPSQQMAHLVVRGEARYPGPGVQVSVTQGGVVLRGIVGPGQGRPVPGSSEVVRGSQISDICIFCYAAK